MSASQPISTHDLDYVKNARSVVRGDEVSGANLLLWVIAGGIGVFFLWASQAPLDEATKGIGKVIPSASLQTVQNLEGGILAELLVQEGQRVSEGDILVRIDDTQSRSSFREDLSKQQALRAALARLDSEAHGLEKLEFPSAIMKDRADLIERETSLFQKRAADLKDQVETLEASLRLASEELAMTVPLVAKEVVPKVDQLRLEREVVVTRGELTKLTMGFRRDAMEQFNTTKAEIERLDEALSGRADRMDRTVVRSPVSGTVNHLHIKTLGGVLQPGQPIVDIVPDGDSLLVEARIRPADIGFIHPGQEATVKFTAYDFGLYGGLRGQVEHISADTIEYEVDRQHYYMIKVRNKTGKLIKDGVELPIIPGMISEIDVLTGRRTVLQYLMKPVNRMRTNALHER
jgi:membrane fusion protein, adhesin transport system